MRTALKAVPKGQRRSRQISLASIRFRPSGSMLVRSSCVGRPAGPRQYLDGALEGHLAHLDARRDGSVAGREGGSRQHDPADPLLFGAAAAIYLVFSILSGIAQGMMERRVNRVSRDVADHRRQRRQFFNFEMMERYGWRLVDGLRVTAEVVSLSVLFGFLILPPIRSASPACPRTRSCPAPPSPM